MTPLQAPLLRSDAQVAASPALECRDSAAFELKFTLTPLLAARVEAWARTHLLLDPHGHNGTYRVSSLYCDTSGFDVFHRTKGNRRTKFRIRRYGDEPLLHLERKRKKSDQVRKRRSAVSIDWPGPFPGLLGPEASEAWFVRQIQARQLRPVCVVGYERTAFGGSASEGPVRLTLDRGLIGRPAQGWAVPTVEEGETLLPEAAILEMKFCARLPLLFRDLLEMLPGKMAGASKYRLCVGTLGIERSKS